MEGCCTSSTPNISSQSGWRYLETVIERSYYYYYKLGKNQNVFIESALITSFRFSNSLVGQQVEPAIIIIMRHLKAAFRSFLQVFDKTSYRCAAVDDCWFSDIIETCFRKIQPLPILMSASVEKVYGQRYRKYSRVQGGQASLKGTLEHNSNNYDIIWPLPSMD